MSLLQRKFGVSNTGQGGPEIAVSATGHPTRLAAAQRIRVGLTGLAAIFLLLLIAAAGMRPTESLAAQGTQTEPLAVLGVAPGAGPTALTHDAQPKPPAVRPART
jgi:hypothetical protein